MKDRVVWPGLDFDQGVGMFTQRHDELLSFFDARTNVLKAKQFLSVRAFLRPVRDGHPWENNFFMHKCLFQLSSYLIFHSTEFQFVLAVGNRSKRIVQLSWLSLCINLTKGHIDRSKGQRAYLFVNARKEDVKFSRINCFASLFGIIRNLQYWWISGSQTPYSWISVFCQWIRFVFKNHRTFNLFNHKPSP